METKRTRAQWQKHEQQQGRLLMALAHYQRAGHTDEKILEIVTSMLAFNHQWDSWAKEPASEPAQDESSVVAQLLIADPPVSAATALE